MARPGEGAGYVTVAGLQKADPATEAVRLGCTHFLSGTEAIAAGPGEGG